jgi:hypothetical protein
MPWQLLGEIAAVLLGVRRWCVVQADALDVLRWMVSLRWMVDHVVTDPPYSLWVHSRQRRMLRGAGRGTRANTKKARDGIGRGEVGFAPLGFEHLRHEDRRVLAWAFSRLARRWILVFTDEESRHLWQADLERAGGRHVRCGKWHKLAGQPQLSGDRPAVSYEAVEVAHARGQRCRWNGGGLPAWWESGPPECWEHQIATDRCKLGDRVHSAQKPESLMREMIEQFTDPGEVVLDPCAGSGTTGAAALRRGRRVILIEKDPGYAEIAWKRLDLQDRGMSLRALRGNQQDLFEGVGR